MRAERGQVIESILSRRGTVMLVGAIDSGKTTFAIELLERARAAGVTAAFVDADIGHSTCGPPTTVGMKLCKDLTEISPVTLADADALGFVGAVTPREHLLPLVTSSWKLTERARKTGAELVVVDTTGFVSGIYGQLLKFHKMDAIRPDFVVAFERGGELEPIVGIAQRFASAEVLQLEAPADLHARSAEDRASRRASAFASYFKTSSRWRVKPTVFMPTVPPELDLQRLEGLVVGMEDGDGSSVGIGVLEFDPAENVLRMVSPVREGVKGLRLGSVKIDAEGRSRGAVSLRQLFGTE